MSHPRMARVIWALFGEREGNRATSRILPRTHARTSAGDHATTYDRARMGRAPRPRDGRLHLARLPPRYDSGAVRRRRPGHVAPRLERRSAARLSADRRPRWQRLAVRPRPP